MQIFLVVVVSLFGGMALTGFAVFLYFQFQAVRKLTVVGEKVLEVMQPFAQGHMASELLKALQKMNGQGKEIVACITALTPTISAFNKMMFQQQTAAAATAESAQPIAGEVIKDMDSIFVVPTEEDQVRAEAAAEARKNGVELEGIGEQGNEPPLSEMVGAQV